MGTALDENLDSEQQGTDRFMNNPKYTFFFY
jgi:hypothetical protein